MGGEGRFRAAHHDEHESSHVVVSIWLRVLLLWKDVQKVESQQQRSQALVGDWAMDWDVRRVHRTDSRGYVHIIRMEDFLNAIQWYPMIIEPEAWLSEHVERFLQ